MTTDLQTQELLAVNELDNEIRRDGGIVDRHLGYHSDATWLEREGFKSFLGLLGDITAPAAVETVEKWAEVLDRNYPLFRKVAAFLLIADVALDCAPVQADELVAFEDGLDRLIRDAQTAVKENAVDYNPEYINKLLS